MYRDYTLVHPVPNLPGIPSKEFLLLLKWIGIQEDLNYLGKYQTLLPGFEFRIAKKGVGRKKFFAALVLAKHHDSEFNSEEIKKIAGFY